MKLSLTLLSARLIALVSSCTVSALSRQEVIERSATQSPFARLLLT